MSSVPAAVGGARRAGVGVLLAVCVPGLLLAFQQQAIFRGGVDLVSVETQVIDKDGQPIDNLTDKNFQVWINGQERKLVSADRVTYPLAAPRSLAFVGLEAPGALPRTDLPDINGRVIVLAVDEVSFGLGSFAPVLQGANKFLTDLPPEDVVALYSYPFGNGRLDFNHFHNQIGLQLARIRGVRLAPATGEFHLSPSEAVDIAANDSLALDNVYSRECMLMVGSGCIDKDDLSHVGVSTCRSRIQVQARDEVQYLEQISSQSFSGLQSLLQMLSAISGPKTVVLLSAGVLSSDRTGGRPDVSSMMTHAGQLAAAADARLYTLHMDGSSLDSASAVGMQMTFSPCQRGVSGGFASQSRDTQLGAIGLERLAGEAGGQYFRSVGTGETVFNRVNRETSSYYVLGVQPEDIDRDGRVHFIRVKAVDVKGATVRARTQVTIPKADSSTGK